MKLHRRAVAGLIGIVALSVGALVWGHPGQAVADGGAWSTRTVTPLPHQIHTDDLYKRETDGFCERGSGADTPPPSGILAGYANAWDGPCHFGDVYRGEVRFDLEGGAGLPASKDIVSAMLYFAGGLSYNTAADGSTLYGAETCGAGDQLLVGTDSAWWLLLTSDLPSWMRGDMRLWPVHDPDVSLLPGGTSFSAATDHLAPHSGAAGIDILSLVRMWNDSPDLNNGLVFRGTVNEGMATDLSACFNEYRDFRLVITYVPTYFIAPGFDRPDLAALIAPLPTCGSKTGTPQLASPIPGSKLSGSAVSFCWTTSSGVKGFWLTVHDATIFSPDLYDSGELSGSTTRISVTRLPTDGRTLFVGLRWLTDAGWQSATSPIRYTAAK